MAWVIVDLEDRIKTTAEEIVLPPRHTRETLRPGWFAKLRFEQYPTTRKPPPAEILWVRVSSELEDGKYEGCLTANSEILRDGLKKGLVVSFEPKNVLDFVDA